MKIAMFRPRDESEGKPEAGVVLASGELLGLEEAARVSGVAADEAASLRSIETMLRDWEASLGLARRIVDEAEDSKEARFAADSVKYLPPLPRPGKVICPGLNFAEHISESQDSVGKKPPMPVGFAKFATALMGHGEALVLPEWIDRVDYEVEVAAALSRRAKRGGRGEALSYIAGYTILNDVSARGVQFEEMKMGMLLLGKNFDGFAPMGPWLVTADEVPDPQGLEIELWIEGEDEPRQKSNTRNMIFSFAELIEYWSQMTLEAGDVISSGTPSGVAAFRKPDPGKWYLKPGQTMVCKVEKVGELRMPIVSGRAAR